MSHSIIAIINMSQQYRCKPSDIMHLAEYPAYCFDEACYYIITQLNDNKKPRFPEDRRTNPLLRKMEMGQF